MKSLETSAEKAVEREENLLLQLLFSLHSLLGGCLQGLHVLADHLELLLDALELVLSKFSPLDCPLELVLLHAELPAQLIQLLLVVCGHLGGGPQVLVQLLQGDLVVHAGALNSLHLLQDVVSLLRGGGQLGDCASQVLPGALRFLSNSSR